MPLTILDSGALYVLFGGSWQAILVLALIILASSRVFFLELHFWVLGTFLFTEQYNLVLHIPAKGR